MGLVKPLEVNKFSKLTISVVYKLVLNVGCYSHVPALFFTLSHDLSIEVIVTVASVAGVGNLFHTKGHVDIFIIAFTGRSHATVTLARLLHLVY